MKEDAARMRCSVCGCETGARVNKNGIIYTYCHNSHHTRLSREDSRAAIAAINAGNKWTNGIIHIYPYERKQENGTNTGANPTGTYTTDNYRRTNGQSAAFTTAAVRSVAADTDESDDFSFGCI